jgi:hypothetical protein
MTNRHARNARMEDAGGMYYSRSRVVYIAVVLS